MPNLRLGHSEGADSHSRQTANPRFILPQFQSKRIVIKPSLKDSERLAILGGMPAFCEPLHVGRPNLPAKAEYIARISSMLDSGWLSNGGPIVREFEAAVARMSGARHCVATCNGTIALELAISAIGLTGEVIVPSFTFVATVHALKRQGVVPVFCDIDLSTHCLDPASVESAITPRTSGIMAVTLWGNPGDELGLRKVADKYGLKLIFDSAHAFGCDLSRPNGQRQCDLEVYSFHATKCIQALEGGAIVTDNTELAERLRLSGNFGFSGEDTVTLLGTNAKMNEAAAAMGLCSIDKADVIFERNRQNFEAYAQGIEGLSGLRIAVKPVGERHNHQYVVLEIDETLAGLSRDRFVAALRAENVLARRYFYPGVHRMAPYAPPLDGPKLFLPNTEQIAERVVVMPTGMSITPIDVARICERIAAILRQSRDVSASFVDGDSRLPLRI